MLCLIYNTKWYKICSSVSATARTWVYIYVTDVQYCNAVIRCHFVAVLNIKTRFYWKFLEKQVKIDPINNYWLKWPNHLRFLPFWVVKLQNGENLNQKMVHYNSNVSTNFLNSLVLIKTIRHGSIYDYIMVWKTFGFIFNCEVSCVMELTSYDQPITQQHKSTTARRAPLQSK